jgi:signal transduction histidine kinase
VQIEVRVLWSEEADPDGVELVVRDTGPGIAEEDRGLLFREFSRLSTDREGSGLGLAISRRIARALGGDVRLESAPGEGSAFTLVLPLRPPAEVEEDAESAAGDRPADRPRPDPKPSARQGRRRLASA